MAWPAIVVFTEVLAAMAWPTAVVVLIEVLAAMTWPAIVAVVTEGLVAMVWPTIITAILPATCITLCCGKGIGWGVDVILLPLPLG